MDDILDSKTFITLKNKLEIEDKENRIIARAVITEKKKSGFGGMFGFGKKDEEPEPEKNEIKAIIFKRIGREKDIFSEARWLK